MTEIQKCLKQILFNTVELLEKNGINYWVAFGTTLGAIRHHGFIPWDDDIDIYIDGADYDRVKELFSDNKYSFLEFHDYISKRNYPFTFPKIVDRRTQLIEKRTMNSGYSSGVYIDVFPLFSVSNNSFIRFIESRIRYINYCIVESWYFNKENENRRYIRLFSSILQKFDFNKAQTRILKEVKKGIRETNYLMHPIRFNDKRIHKRVNFTSFDYLEFEGRKVRVPLDVKSYLFDQYGDYMKLPPEEKRVSEHNYVELDVHSALVDSI